VHRSREQFLAGARLAAEQHGRIGRSDHVDVGEHPPQRGAAADDVVAQAVFHSRTAERDRVDAGVDGDLKVRNRWIR
jgi:hypothetical protein